MHPTSSRNDLVRWEVERRVWVNTTPLSPRDRSIHGVSCPQGPLGTHLLNRLRDNAKCRFVKRQKMTEQYSIAAPRLWLKKNVVPGRCSALPAQHSSAQRAEAHTGCAHGRGCAGRWGQRHVLLTQNFQTRDDSLCARWCRPLQQSPTRDLEVPEYSRN